MITKSTVFVLGAGASWVYGFPLGSPLKQNLISQLTTATPDRSAMMEYADFSEADISVFCRELQHSAQYSVDAFLEHRPEFFDIGKAALAVMLINHERPGALWERD